MILLSFIINQKFIKTVILKFKFNFCQKKHNFKLEHVLVLNRVNKLIK